jgi:oxygen-dependent protoporphyrinogen oxidase
MMLPRGLRQEDESLAGFVRRRFGREALERMAQPMASGIYGADPEVLSLQATMPRFLEWEQQYGSVIRGLRAERGRNAAAVACRGSDTARSSATASGPRYGLFVTLADGLQTLVEALAARLPSGVVRFGCEVAGLQPDGRDGEPRWRVMLADGEMLGADGVCVALPAHRAATLIRGFDGALADDLSAIRYTSVAVVHLAYRRADVRHPLDGFGFVVPAAERRPILGCTFSSVKFLQRAPEDAVLLRAFLGGELQAAAYALDDAAMLEAVRREVETLLGIGAPPLWSGVTRHPEAIPQFHVGHLQRVEVLERRAASWPGLALAGNAYRGLGVPDCVRSGEQAAEALLKQLEGSSCVKREAQDP